MTDKRSISTYGLKKYLDGTAWKHNNNDYSDLLRMLKENKKDPKRFPIMEIGRHFNVDRRTVTNWLELLKKENPNAR